MSALLLNLFLKEMIRQVGAMAHPWARGLMKECFWKLLNVNSTKVVDKN